MACSLPNKHLKDILSFYFINCKSSRIFFPHYAYDRQRKFYNIDPCRENEAFVFHFNDKKIKDKLSRLAPSIRVISF